MDNQSYFKDIDREIKKLGCVTTLVILESKRIAYEVFRDAEFYPSVLQVLTHLTAQQLNIDEVSVKEPRVGAINYLTAEGHRDAEEEIKRWRC